MFFLKDDLELPGWKCFQRSQMSFFAELSPKTNWQIWSLSLINFSLINFSPTNFSPFSLQITTLNPFKQPRQHPQIIGVLSVLFICMSILSFCLKTHPNMRVPLIQNRTVHGSLPNGSIVDKWVLTKTQTNPHDSFFYIEAVCNAWFTIEIIMRFSSAPNKVHFILGGVNIIDFIATFSFFLDLALQKVRWFKLVPNIISSFRLQILRILNFVGQKWREFNKLV